jgi:competence protein ComEA
MLTRDERRGLLFLATIAVAGGVMRVVRAPSAAPGASIVAPELAAGDVARQAQLARHALEMARPLLPGERVDVDRAGPEELERLPRVGPAMARRIVDEREAHGPFGSLEGLKRVSGIGPATLRGFERTTTFSGSREPGAVPSVRPEGTAPDSRLPLRSQ